MLTIIMQMNLKTKEIKKPTFIETIGQLLNIKKKS